MKKIWIKIKAIINKTYTKSIIAGLICFVSGYLCSYYTNIHNYANVLEKYNSDIIFYDNTISRYDSIATTYSAITSILGEVINGTKTLNNTQIDKINTYLKYCMREQITLTERVSDKDVIRKEWLKQNKK